MLDVTLAFGNLVFAPHGFLICTPIYKSGLVILMFA